MQPVLARIRPYLVPAIVLILLTLVVYGRTVGFEFLTNWDDEYYVTHNPDIRGFGVINLLRVFTSSYVGNYAPLHILSYMLDYQLAGLNPAWFHGVNVVIHTVNGLLFYLLVRRLTGKPFWAFVSAAVFLLHPVQVESVAWVSQRKNVVAMLFSLCSFLCYISYRQGSGERNRAYRYSLLFLVAALLAKSIAVIMPFVFLLHDYCLVSQPRGREHWADKIPFLIAVVLASGITMVTQSAEMGGGIIDYFEGRTAVKILTMLTVLTSYLRILVWPSNLSLIYVFVMKKQIDVEVAFALLLIAALCLLGMYLLRRERRLFFGFAIFFLGLLPVSQIVPLATLMNDRYLYFPMLGAAWMVGGYLSRLNDAYSGERFNPTYPLVLALIVPCLVLSFQRTAVWQDSIALWSDTSIKLPTLKDPLATLGEAYGYAGQPKKALEAYEKAFALERAFSDVDLERKALNDAAGIYLSMNLPEKALPLLAKLTTKFPGFGPGFLKLGHYYEVTKNPLQAEKAYRNVLLLIPGNPPATISLGNLCLESGRLVEAREFYHACFASGGDGPDLQFNMACVEALDKNTEQALQHLEAALKLGYRNADAITGNPELASLRQHPAFGQLVSRYFDRP